MLCGTKATASEITLKDVKNGELYGTLSANRASTTLDAVSALLTVQQVQLTLEFLAKRILMAEVGVRSSAVVTIRR